MLLYVLFNSNKLISMNYNELQDFKVDKEQFTSDVIEYGKLRKEYEARSEEPPRPNNKIGDAIYKICYGVSMRPNFRGYSYREEMMLDAIEDCTKAVKKFDPDAATRSGTPNAHGYFSQVAYWAMVRRIKMEEKEVNGKIDLIHRSGIDAFIAPGDVQTSQMCDSYLNELRSSTSSYEKKKDDAKTKHYGWSAPATNKKKGK